MYDDNKFLKRIEKAIAMAANSTLTIIPINTPINVNELERIKIHLYSF
jgi:hypothetical protein